MLPLRRGVKGGCICDRFFTFLSIFLELIRTFDYGLRPQDKKTT